MSDLLRMHALADGHLEGEEKMLAEGQLAESKACRAEFESVRMLKTTLSEKAETISCDKTWAKCRERIAELDRKKSIESVIGKYAWALCSTFLVFIVTAAVLNRTVGARDLRTGDVAKILGGFGKLSSSDGPPIEDMQKWIRTTPVTIDVGKLRTLGFAQGNYEGRNAALLTLADGEGFVQVVIVRGAEEVVGAEPMSGGGDYRICLLNGMNCITWTDADFSLFLVGPRAPESLRGVAESIRLRR